MADIAVWIAYSRQLWPGGTLSLIPQDEWEQNFRQIPLTEIPTLIRLIWGGGASRPKDGRSHKFMGDRKTPYKVPNRIGPNMVDIVAAHPERCRILWNDGRCYKYVQCSNPGCGRWGWLTYFERKLHEPYCSDLCALTHRPIIRRARNNRYRARRGLPPFTDRTKAPVVRAMFPDRFGRKHKLVDAVALHPQQCRILWNHQTYKYVRCSYLQCGKWYWRIYAANVTYASATPKAIYCADACAKANATILHRAREKRCDARSRLDPAPSHNA